MTTIDFDNAKIEVSENDIEALSRIAYAEARNIAANTADSRSAYGSVIDVVLNRAVANRRSWGGDQIQDVINHSNRDRRTNRQTFMFSPHEEAGGLGWRGLLDPPEEVKKTVRSYVRDLGRGKSNIVGDATHFLNPHVSGVTAANRGGWAEDWRDWPAVGDGAVVHHFGNPDNVDVPDYWTDYGYGPIAESLSQAGFIGLDGRYVPGSGGDPSAPAGGLAIQRSSAPQAGTLGVPALAPVPIPAPRGLLAPPSPEITRSIAPQTANVPVPLSRPDADASIDPSRLNERFLPPAPAFANVPVPTPAPRASRGPSSSLVPHNASLPVVPQRTRANGLLGSPEAFASRKVGAQNIPYVAGQSSPDTSGRTDNLLSVEPQNGVPVPTSRPDRSGLGYDAVPADQLGNAQRSTAARVGSGLAPLAAGAVGGPLAGLAVRGLMRQAGRSGPGYFPDAPGTGSGGLLGGLFGSPTYATSGNRGDLQQAIFDEASTGGSKNSTGSKSFAGTGMNAIQGIMSTTGPGVANPSPVGLTAMSRSNPEVSVVSLGPMGYARETPHGVSIANPFGTSFHAGKQVAVDPTSRTGFSLVAIGTPGRRGVRSTSRGIGFGRGPSRGLASFFSSLFGPAMTTAPAPAVGPAAVSFAPGPTTGPLGFSTGGPGGSGFGFGGLGGSIGLSGPAFGGGAHSNSTDAR